MIKHDVEILDRAAAFEGYCRVDRYRLRHRLHRGGWSGEVTRELVDRGHAAGVLPYDPDRDEVVLIEQFRIGAHVAGRAPWLTELVAGIIEPGESAEDVARREAREEAGIELGELVPVADYLSSPGILSETVTLYCGRVDAEGVGGIHGVEHEGEDIRVFTAPFAEIETWLTEGRVSNGILLIALQWLVLNHQRLRRDWRVGPSRDA